VPASRLNYLVMWRGHSQIYGAASEKVARSNPTPEGCRPEDRRILFVTHRPDEDVLMAHLLPEEEGTDDES
jgi:hypothetical protein